MSSIPIVRIEVEHMKQSIIHAFSEKQLDIDKDFKIALDTALVSFNFPEEVQKMAHEVLKTELRNAVQRAVWDIVDSVEWKKAIKTLLVKALKLAVEELR